MEPLDYWRLCDELSIIQAALLMAGEDPGPAQEYVEQWEPDKRPIGYEAAKQALSAALKRKVIAGRVTLLAEHDINGNHLGWIEDSIDLKASYVFVSSLCQFLQTRGYKEGFFAPLEKLAPDYVDTQNPHYAPKLAAAVEAWQAVSSDSSLVKGKTPKQALEIWLRKNADKFSLTKEDGNPNEQGIEEISKIANWNTKGGAPKTPTSRKEQK